jgi:hypothetical protein
MILLTQDSHSISLTVWRKYHNEFEIRQSLACLMELNIISIKDTDDDSRLSVKLNYFICQWVLTAIKPGSSHQSITNVPKFEISRTFSNVQLESNLVLLGSTNSMFAPLGQLLGFLGFDMFELKKINVNAGLWKKTENYGFILTNSGVKFMLMDRHIQFYILLRELLRLDWKYKSKLAFTCMLIRLSCFQATKFYHVQSLKYNDRKNIIKLMQLGLLEISHRGSWFTSSMFMTNFSSVECDEYKKHNYYSFIVIEANNRLYGNTCNPLNSILLNFIMEIDLLLPNLLIGSIKKYRSRQYGLTAKDVLSYLDRNMYQSFTQQISIEIPEIALYNISESFCHYLRFPRLATSLMIRYENCVHFKSIEAKAIETNVLFWSSKVYTTSN